MDIAQVKKQFSDKLSICLSLCCILHCIALPVIILMIPSIASLWINNEKVHVILVLFAVPISLFAMAKSLRIHHNYKCISLAVIGLSLLVSAIFMHNINFGSESSHIGHGEATHNEEAGHKDAKLGIINIITGKAIQCKIQQSERHIDNLSLNCFFTCAIYIINLT